MRGLRHAHVGVAVELDAQHGVLLGRVRGEPEGADGGRQVERVADADAILERDPARAGVGGDRLRARRSDRQLVLP